MNLKLLLPMLLACAVAHSVQAKLNVVATTPDLGALAQEIGGEHVKVTSLALGSEDPHFTDPKPSYMRTLNQADALIETGADLESGWLPPLLQGARNAKIIGASPGHIIASQGLTLIDAGATLSRAEGDVHPKGNPHFLLDPGNARFVAAHLAAKFAELDPPHGEAFTANLRKFEAALAEKDASWKKRLEPFRGTRVLTYHKSFNYLLAHFGFELVDTLEPKPGIEPTATHIRALIPRAKAAGVKLVLMEPNRPRKTAQQVASQVGAKVVVLPLMPGGVEQAKDFFSWYDFIVGQLAASLP